MRFRDVIAKNPIYPLTDRAISGLPHDQQVRVLAERGVSIVQLREKEFSSRDLYLAAIDALEAARDHGISLIINDRVDIALAIKADGVHLGQDDLPPDSARWLLGPKAIIGISTHNLTQAKMATQLPVDYIAIGPIFPTGTKKSSNPPVGLDGLRRIRDRVGDIPLVAIGGIAEAQFDEVLRAGADALAVITTLWRPPNASD